MTLERYPGDVPVRFVLGPGSVCVAVHDVTGDGPAGLGAVPFAEARAVCVDGRRLVRPGALAEHDHAGAEVVETVPRFVHDDPEDSYPLRASPRPRPKSTRPPVRWSRKLI